MNRRNETEYCDIEVYAKDKGNAWLSYLLDCVRQGKCADVQVALKDPEFSVLTQIIIGDELPFAQMVFQYIAPQIARAALDGGMSWTAATMIYQSYIDKARKTKSVKALFELYNEMFIYFAAAITSQLKENIPYSSLVRRCQNFISNHLYESLSLERIAAELQISKSHLSHLYKRETGKTITDYVREKKVSEAKVLLQLTPASLAEIGERLGFCSQSHFTDTFRKETGMTPLQFRNQ